MQWIVDLFWRNLFRKWLGIAGSSLNLKCKQLLLILMLVRDMCWWLATRTTPAVLFLICSCHSWVSRHCNGCKLCHWMQQLSKQLTLLYCKICVQSKPGFTTSFGLNWAQNSLSQVPKSLVAACYSGSLPSVISFIFKGFLSWNYSLVTA